MTDNGQDVGSLTPAARTDYAVRAVRCDHRADDEAVYEALARATAPLARSWARLGKARKIAVKLNQDFPKKLRVIWRGRRRQLVCDAVARALFRLLRERTDAELVCVDAGFWQVHHHAEVAETMSIGPILREFDVRYVDGSQPPNRTCRVPGGGRMFREYTMVTELLDADALVSVAKMKNHKLMGITGCLKNLFGLMPGTPWGRPRRYYHHLVRMPYVLADIGRILDPALNVVDGLVAQAGMEWNKAEALGRVMDTLIAGDHAVATDACMAHLMGHDPTTDWLTQPFLRDRNALLVAAEGGFGTVDLDRIDFASEPAPREPGVFYCHEREPLDLRVSWRRTMCEEALRYRDNRDKFKEYTGQYVLLQDGEVRWHSADGQLRQSRSRLSGNRPEHALFFKYVDPAETEGEHDEVYEQALAHLETIGRHQNA